VTRLAEKALLVARSIRKPVSLLALSVQVRLIWVAPEAAADRLAGAAGTVPVAAGVVTEAVLEAGELPALLVAKTRK
jgi:hypothetical protein